MSNHGGVEIEVKLRLPENLNPIRRKLRETRFHVAKRRTLETNALFDNPEHSLRNQGKLIRIRHAGTRSVLTYKGPSTLGSRHKRRPEIEIDLPDPLRFEEILRQIGYDTAFRYEKFRTEYSTHPNKGTVMLDETPIGNFLEVEGSARWIDRTAKILGFAREDYITSSYGHLYLNYCRERKIQPGNMLFSKPRRTQ
ncbi:MAG TPA: class IV adenylate cyclase [Bryobacteraceae bacterium]|nr:class IV adenylate cyclase [Bryobacteraceae bacterium]